MAGRRHSEQQKERFFGLLDKGGTVRAAAAGAGVGEAARPITAAVHGPTVGVDPPARRSTLSRAGGLQPHTQDALDVRGLLEPLLASGDFPAGNGHFVGIPLVDRPDGRPWRSVPQNAVEELLERHLADHGVPVRRDHELTALTQDGDGVTATFRHGPTVRARHLVATDGAHSTVRSLLGPPSPDPRGP